MTRIDANDLATHSDEMQRQIGQTGQPIDIIENGVIVARVIPIYGHPTSKDLATFWADWDMMYEDIGEELERQGIKTFDAVELMKDVRG